MVAWSEAELDEITDEFLALMLDEREFIDLWTANVEQDLARTEAKKSVGTALPSNSPMEVSKRQDTLLAIFEELTHAVDASSQTFLSSADFTICHCEPEHNRDASLLFAARLQIDRISSRKVDRSRSEAAARRLLQLVRLFTTRISSAFQISNTSAFATSLCDMLYTFCEGTSITLTESERNNISALRRAVDDFNEIVVEKLSKAAFEAQCARKSTATPPRQQFFSPQPARLRRPLVQIQQRSPGYLLPPDLLKKRQKLARSRSQPLMFPSTNHGLTRKSTSKSTAPAASAARRDPPLQRRYGEQALEPDEATIRLARKISSEVMRDLRRKYGNVDIGMLGI